MIKNYIIKAKKLSKKIILGYSFSFILGIVIGYSLGLLKVHTMLFKVSILNKAEIVSKLYYFLSQIQNILKLTKFLINSVHFIPSTGFLSDIIAVQAAIIAIAIPISFDVISRISERYKSSVIIQQFNQQWQVKILPSLLIFNIALSVCLKFLIKNDPASLVAITLLYLAFTSFLVILLFLVSFFYIIQKYSVNTSYLLNKIYKNIDTNLNIEKLLKIKDNEKLENIQNKLIQSLEAIGDILVFEVSDKKANNTIKNGFQKIKDSIITIFQIKEENTELFEVMLVSSDFYNLSQKNPQEASYRLLFNSDEALITLATAVNQIIRIHETAVNCQNSEISRYSVYNIVSILRKITISPDNHIIVKKLLKDLTDMRRISIQNKDSSARLASILWYTNIVFDSENKFNLSHLDVFDEYFWSSIKYIIIHGEMQIFKDLVSTVMQGITPSISLPRISANDCFKTYIYSSNTYDNEIMDSISSLDSKMYNIDTQSELNNWINQFDYLKHIVDVKLKNIEDENNKDKIKFDINLTQEIIRNVTEEFKYKNLKIIIFYTAAYCLFKQKFSYIQSLWTYNQPSDADASFLNRNIVPSGLGEIIHFYFKSNLIQRRYWWDDHHGSEIYVKKYFLLLLIREFCQRDSNSYQSITNNFNLSNDFDSYNLFRIKDWTDEYIKVAEEIKQDNNLLRHLDFDLTQATESIKNGVIPFLKELKVKAEKKIILLKRNQKISMKKVQNFKHGFHQGFSELSYVREIFEHFKLYKTENNQKISEDNYGLYNLFPKENFLENWYSSYPNSGKDMGKNCGRQLAISENKKIIQEISEYCETVDDNSLETILDCLNNQIRDIFIIASFEVMSDWRRSRKFKDDYDYSSDFQPLNLKSFQGYYLSEDNEIPVLYINSEIIDNNILFLNNSRLGTLIQYLYNNAENSEQSKQFQIEIEAFSEDAELLKNTLKNSPKWLLEKGNRKQQQEYLEENVSIKIIENFEFKKHPEFQGYIVTVENL